MGEQRTTRQEQSSPLSSERGNTTIADTVVSKIAGIAAQEVEGAQMGGGSARAVGAFLDSVTGSIGGGGGQTRGVSVEVGQEEAAIDLSMAIEYGRSIPRITQAVRRNVVSHLENMTGLRVHEVNITVNDVVLTEERPQLERQRELEREAREQEERQS